MNRSRPRESVPKKNVPLGPTGRPVLLRPLFVYVVSGGWPTPRGNRRREDGQQREQEDDDQGGDRHLVLAQPAPGQHPRAAALDHWAGASPAVSAWNSSSVRLMPTFCEAALAAAAAAAG